MNDRQRNLSRANQMEDEEKHAAGQTIAGHAHRRTCCSSTQALSTPTHSGEAHDQGEIVQGQSCDTRREDGTWRKEVV